MSRKDDEHWDMIMRGNGEDKLMDKIYDIEREVIGDNLTEVRKLTLWISGVMFGAAAILVLINDWSPALVLSVLGLCGGIYADKFMK